MDSVEAEVLSIKPARDVSRRAFSFLAKKPVPQGAQPSDVATTRTTATQLAGAVADPR